MKAISSFLDWITLGYLWKLLDEEMKLAYECIQSESELEDADQFWEDEQREAVFEWFASDDKLQRSARLKLYLWNYLRRTTYLAKK